MKSKLLYDKILKSCKNDSSTDDKLDIIFNNIDNLLLNDEYDIVNNMFQYIINDDIGITCLLGILIASYPFNNKLSNWKYLNKSIYDYTVLQKGEIEADKILYGFKYNKL